MPMPIFQSKPSGLMTGSIRRPMRPAKLWRSFAPASSFSREAEEVRGERGEVRASEAPIDEGGASGAEADDRRSRGGCCGNAARRVAKSFSIWELRGYVARNHRMMLMPRITVPARRRKIFERSHM